MYDDYLERITKYIFDNRFSRALLIDGDWGCGKSFFVKNTLITEIEKTNVESKMKEVNSSNDSQDGKTKCCSALMISLYGISDIESIHTAIYSAYLEKMTDSISNKALGKLFNHASLLGVTALKGISSHFGVGDEADSLLSKIGDGVLCAKKEDIVLIFDDIERCQIDIIELMGFLNNLCENIGYRVILIANENEIAKQVNGITHAIQSQTALIDLYGMRVCAEKNIKMETASGSRKRDLNVKNFRGNTDICGKTMDSLLENHRKSLFGENTVYEQTREKLIGLTVRFSSNIKDVYEDVLDKIIPEGIIRNYLLEKKSLVVETFDSHSHENIRTLISVFISVEAIMTVLKTECNLDNEDKDRVNVDEIIEEEKDRLLLYIIRTAINKANGVVNLLHENNGIRYGFVTKGLFSNEQPYFMYAFVDDYWKTLVVDSDVISFDFNSRLNDRISVEIDRIKDAQHSKLSLFRLREWYYHSDVEVKEDIKKLKEELKEKKYFPYEFKEIILTLMKINDSECGMGLRRADGKSEIYIYDSADNTTFSEGDSREENKKEDDSSNVNYDLWDQEDIDEYVNLMMKYTEDEDFSISDDMLRVISEDRSSVEEYKRHVKLLLEWIRNKELSDLKRTDGGEDVFEIKGSELQNFFQSHRDAYITKRKFLSLYGYDRIERKIRESETEYLWEMSDAIRKVYKCGVLGEFLSEDYDTVNRIWQDLANDRETDRSRFNPHRERTREMALRRLETDFELYRNQIRDLNELIEE